MRYADFSDLRALRPTFDVIRSHTVILTHCADFRCLAHAVLPNHPHVHDIDGVKSCNHDVGVIYCQEKGEKPRPTRAISDGHSLPKVRQIIMAEQPKPSELYETLKGQLRACKTVTDLFKLANSDDFKASAAKLNPNELRELRAEYRSMQTSLDGKVKLDMFDGQIVHIADIDYWKTDRFVDEARGQTGDGVTLTIYPENDPDKRYRALTSSAIIVRFAANVDVPPTRENPIRALLTLVPVKDPERAAKGQKMWKIKRLAPAHKPGDGSENSPF